MISDFAKGIQTDINHYMTRDRIKNTSFRQRFDPISKNILRSQNPVELVLKTFQRLTLKNQLLVLC